MTRGLDHLIPPPVVALICGLAMWALGPAPAGHGPRSLSLAIALAGLAVAAAGALQFRRRGANINPHHIERGEVLVTDGVYNLTRNPMYLGIALVLLAYAVYQMRIFSFLGPVAFVAYITRFQIAPEEAAMRRKFGEAYEIYTRRVRRWI